MKCLNDSKFMHQQKHNWFTIHFALYRVGNSLNVRFANTKLFDFYFSDLNRAGSRVPIQSPFGEPRIKVFLFSVFVCTQRYQKITAIEKLIWHQIGKLFVLSQSYRKKMNGSGWSIAWKNTRLILHVFS